MPQEDKAPAWALDDDDVETGGRPSTKTSSSYSAPTPSYTYKSSAVSSYPVSSSSSKGGNVDDEEEGDDFDFSKPGANTSNNKRNDDEEEEVDEGADAWGAPPAKKEPSNDPQQLLMDQFYKDVEAIKTDIDTLKNATKRILDLMEKILASTSEVTDRSLNNDMRQTVDDTNKVAKHAKNLLALLKEENMKYKKEKKIESSNMR